MTLLTVVLWWASLHLQYRIYVNRSGWPPKRPLTLTNGDSRFGSS